MNGRAEPEGAVRASCQVRYVADPATALPEAAVSLVASAVTARAPGWASEVARYLGVEPRGPVTVTLYGGRCVPRTKGLEVILPVPAGRPAVLAGLAHELVHAVAGRSPHPVLNEGLAVHVDSELRLAGPGWPFYHLGPHRWMEVFREEGWRLRLADLLSAPAVRPVAEDHASVRDRAVRYLHAASFTAYLLERLPPERFWAAFRTGQPVPDGAESAALEHDWWARLDRGPLTADERDRCRRSFAIGTPADDAARRPG